jgi:hypothetical protein
VYHGLEARNGRSGAAGGVVVVVGGVVLVVVVLVVVVLVVVVLVVVGAAVVGGVGVVLGVVGATGAIGGLTAVSGPTGGEHAAASSAMRRIAIVNPARVRTFNLSASTARFLTEGPCSRDVATPVTACRRRLAQYAPYAWCATTERARQQPQTRTSGSGQVQ